MPPFVLSFFYSQLLLLGMQPYGVKYSFGHFMPAVLPVPSSASCPRPAYLLWGEGEKSLGIVQALFQQQPKRSCVIRTAFATDSKHSIVLTAVNKINFIPARPSTISAPHCRSFVSYLAGTDVLAPACGLTSVLPVALFPLPPPQGACLWGHHGSRALTTLLEIQLEVLQFCKFAWPSFSFGNFDNLSC